MISLESGRPTGLAADTQLEDPRLAKNCKEKCPHPIISLKWDKGDSIWGARNRIYGGNAGQRSSCPTDFLPGDKVIPTGSGENRLL